MGLIEILLVVLLLVAIAALGYLIFTLKHMNETVERMEGDFKEIKEKTLPALENLNKTLERTVRISDTVERRVLELDEQVDEVRTRITDITDKFTSPDTGNPVTDFFKRVSAVSKAVTAFWSTLRR